MTAQTVRKGATYELQRGYRMMMVPAILAVAIFAVVPLAGMFGLAFSDYHLIRGTNWEFGFRNFAKMLSDKRLMNSIYVMAGRTGAVPAAIRCPACGSRPDLVVAVYADAVTD